VPTHRQYLPRGGTRVAERAPRDNSERLLRGAACRDVKVLLGLALVSLLAAGEGLSSDASPGASLDWTKEDPQHVTKHLLNQVQSATKAWNKIPGQLRQLKKVKKNIVTIEANAGKAVAGLQGEMDKAYAVLAGSDKIDQPTTQVDNKTDVTSKPNPRANAAVNSFFKKTLAPGLDASEEKAAQDVSQEYVEYMKDMQKQVDRDATAAGVDTAAGVSLVNDATQKVTDATKALVAGKPGLSAALHGNQVDDSAHDVVKDNENVLKHLGHTTPNMTSTDTMHKALPNLKRVFDKSVTNYADDNAPPWDIVSKDSQKATRDAEEARKDDASKEPLEMTPVEKDAPVLEIKDDSVVEVPAP